MAVRNITRNSRDIADFDTSLHYPCFSSTSTAVLQASTTPKLRRTPCSPPRTSRVLHAEGQLRGGQLVLWEVYVVARADQVTHV
jgi:hypothetical protein